MEDSHSEIVKVLVQNGYEHFKRPYEKIEFAGNIEADNLLNNLKRFPHTFVLACVMDRRIPAERAWLIPYEISKEIGDFSFSNILQLKLAQTKSIFNKKKLHRYNDLMAENFYLAVQRIHGEYANDAANIWKNNPRSGTVVRRFLDFKGVGVKIATMATNILARDFKIPFKNLNCIDISPDMQVMKVFKRTGLIPQTAKKETLMYYARELNPDYPGVFDLPSWEIGSNWCKPKNPKCDECYLNSYCPKII